MDTSNDSSAGVTAFDQSRYLPNPIKVVLSRIQTLQGKEDFYLWTLRVDNALQEHDLSDLLDVSVPRPKETSPKYKLWRKWSKQVKSWLFKTVSDGILKDVHIPGQTYQYADDFYQAIGRAIVGPPDHSWLEVGTIERGDYTTLKEFIYALCHQIHLSTKANNPFTPSEATSVLFAKVRKEMPTFVAYKAIGLSESARLNMKWSDFFDICKETLEMAPESFQSQDDVCLPKV